MTQENQKHQAWNKSRLSDLNESLRLINEISEREFSYSDQDRLLRLRAAQETILTAIEHEVKRRE